LENECPKCTEINTYTIELNKILPQLKCPNFENLLQVNNLKIKFKPLTYKELNQISLDQFNIQRAFANLESIEDLTVKQKEQEALTIVTTTTMNLIATAIEYIDTPELK